MYHMRNVDAKVTVMISCHVLGYIRLGSEGDVGPVGVQFLENGHVPRGEVRTPLLKHW